jgi:hypothetical protein
MNLMCDVPVRVERDFVGHPVRVFRWHEFSIPHANSRGEVQAVAKHVFICKVNMTAMCCRQQPDSDPNVSLLFPLSSEVLEYLKAFDPRVMGDFSGNRVPQDLTPSRYKCPSGLWHRPPSSEACNSRSFGRTRFEYWQQSCSVQRLPQVRAEITKLEASAFGFCLSLDFDKGAETRTVNIIDLLQINDNPCGAGCEEIVDRCKQPAALLSEHKTPFERQNVDSIHLTLRYFQRHCLPPKDHYADSPMHP